jgi:hypothetical protein
MVVINTHALGRIESRLKLEANGLKCAGREHGDVVAALIDN